MHNSVQGAIKQWMTFVKPNFELFVDPQRKNADILVPRGIDNVIAISTSFLISYTFIKFNA